jgi:murein DD-endopeptidase MepM/ murein hydrolase activator NlpD
MRFLILLPVVVILALGPAAATADEPHGRWPLSPRPAVLADFSPPAARWGSGHRGVDLAGRVGQPVRAALPGTVSFTGRVAGVAVVVVDHGETRTTYQPVAGTVPRGTPVPAGQVVGRLQWFGTHCLPAACLHWGWIRGSDYLDPLLLVGAAPAPVRLLPLTGPLAPSAEPPPPLWHPLTPLTPLAPMALKLPPGL